MKILHTSDWHLGRSLYGRKRYDEFAAFLNWLADLIVSENIDALLVAGDIFDNGTPSNRAQELYYGFLGRVSRSCCRHIVVIAGNHDSPSFLNAPKGLLRALNVFVIGSTSDNLETEVITLCSPSNIPEAIVCAVPYLRDRDIRNVEAGETVADKNLKLVEGMQKHYAEVCRIAEKRQEEYGDIPIIGMGHLFTTGGKTIDGDGVRELYVGSLAHVGEEIFPEGLDYLALGHLHIPQQVGKSAHIRYSGSPIPMGYGEAAQKKSVIVVEFNGRAHQVSEHPVPPFQILEKIVGGIDKIKTRIDALKGESSNAWLEIEYSGIEVVGNLQELMDEAITGSKIEILKIKNQRFIERILKQSNQEETLDDLDIDEVFVRCLDSHEVDNAERPLLIQAFKEIVQDLQEEDRDEI